MRVDGETLDLGGPLLAVAVANAPRLGGVELVDEADLEDGVLDVLAVPGRPWRPGCARWPERRVGARAR